jgi:hypothetical protein
MIRSRAYRPINSPPEDDFVYFRMDLNWGWLGMELKILRNIKRGPYYELNTTGNHWDGSSIILEEGVFDFFSESFYISNHKLNYFGPNTYEGKELLKLQTELTKFGNKLESVRSSESLTFLINNTQMGANLLRGLEADNKQFLKDKWKYITSLLIEINKALLTLIQLCINNNQTLWVLGI